MLLKLDQGKWLAASLYQMGCQLVADDLQHLSLPLLEAACQASLACATICKEAEVRPMCCSAATAHPTFSLQQLQLICKVPETGFKGFNKLPLQAWSEC
jgi:hypothetical protein